MYKNNRFLAIIPARSGSKGIKDKNIKNMNNKPLIAYTIEASIKSKIFDDVIVSTDSFEYRSIARSYGVWVSFLRLNELATDTISTLEVILNLLSEIEKLRKTYDYFVYKKSFYKEKSYSYIMNKAESIDINDIYQFKFVEFLMKYM